MDIDISPLKLSPDAYRWLLAIGSLSDLSLRGNASRIVNHSVLANRPSYRTEIKRCIPSSMKFEDAFRVLLSGTRPLKVKPPEYSRRDSPNLIALGISSLKVGEESNDWLKAIATLRDQPMRSLLSEILEKWILNDGKQTYDSSVKYLAAKHGIDFQSCFDYLVQGTSLHKKG